MSRGAGHAVSILPAGVVVALAIVGVLSSWRWKISETIQIWCSMADNLSVDGPVGVSSLAGTCFCRGVLVA